MSDYIFDAAELTLQDYMRKVQSERVVITRPETVPDRMVQIQKVGGIGDNFTDRPMITFGCFGKSRADAMEFAEEIRYFARQCEELGGLPVYEIRQVSLPSSRPDPDTGRQRYQFTLEFKVRGKFKTPSP